MSDTPKKNIKLTKLTADYFVHHSANRGIEIDLTANLNTQSEPKGEEGETGCSGEDQQLKAIDFSNRIICALENKAKNFNKEHSPKRVTVNRLKSIYCSVVSTCSESDNKNLIGFTRINQFLHTISNFDSLGKVKYDLVLEELDFCSEAQDGDFIKDAEQDIEEFNLNFEFKNLNELFIEIPKSSLGYEIEF
jgi:hypothetical protein